MASEDLRFGEVLVYGERLLRHHRKQFLHTGEPIPLQFSSICGRPFIAGDIGWSSAGSCHTSLCGLTPTSVAIVLNAGGTS